MTTTDKDMENFLPGMKPVLELLEREPEKVDMVYVRKGRAAPKVPGCLICVVSTACASPS